MAAIQTPDEITDLLDRHLLGASLRHVQVLAPNSLKTVRPNLEELAGQGVTAAFYADRHITVTTATCMITVDLQRTGQVRWLDVAERWLPESRSLPPTVRLLLVGGGGLDLIEPGKTKRITISLFETT